MAQNILPSLEKHLSSLPRGSLQAAHLKHAGCHARCSTISKYRSKMASLHLTQRNLMSAISDSSDPVPVRPLLRRQARARASASWVGSRTRDLCLQITVLKIFSWSGSLPESFTTQTASRLTKTKLPIIWSTARWIFVKSRTPLQVRVHAKR